MFSPLKLAMKPFVEEPPTEAVIQKKNASALNDSEFVILAMTALLEANCASECLRVSYCCNPFTVVVGKKKKGGYKICHVL